jgi:hypothetical protein
MRLLIGLLAAAGIAGLTGCAAYDDPYAANNGVVYYGATTTYSTPAYGYYSYNAPVYVQPRTYRDRDGDGVPNLYDRRPDDPYRR